MDEDTWSCSRFSLANPQDGSEPDLPVLLRRVAAEIERRKLVPTDILDVVITNEVTAEGPWWSATVYWSPERNDDET